MWHEQHIMIHDIDTYYFQHYYETNNLIMHDYNFVTLKRQHFIIPEIVLKFTLSQKRDDQKIWICNMNIMSMNLMFINIQIIDNVPIGRL